MRTCRWMLVVSLTAARAGAQAAPTHLPVIDMHLHALPASAYGPPPVRTCAGSSRRGFGKRIMFGSDQNIWPETIPIAIEAVEAAGFLTPEQKRDIFYNNAARFLRLPAS